MPETDLSTADLPNSFYLDILATDSTPKEKYQPFATIEDSNNVVCTLGLINVST